MSGRLLQTLVAMIVAGLWGLLLGLGHLRGEMWFIDRVEATMTDLRTLVRGQREPPDLITIVAIDDETARREGGYPVARAVLARLVDAIASHKPKVVALDMLLVDTGPGDGDRMLAQSLSRVPAVLAAAAVFAESKQWVADANDGPIAGVPSAERFLLPLQVFADVAAVGVVNVASDQTGTPRFFPMLFRSGEQIEASFPLRVAAVAAGSNPEIEPDRLVVGGRTVRTDIGHLLPIAFYGPRGTIRTISAAEVLNGNVAEDDIQGRFVVIGATVTGGGDVFSTPFDPILPGVELVSTAIAQLTTGDGLVRDRSTRLADVGFAVVLPMVLVGLLGWRRNAAGLFALVGVILIWMVVNIAAFDHGLWLSAALPIAAAAPPAILFGAAQLWLGRRRASHFAKQSALLQRIQAPGLGKWLAQDPNFLSEPARQDVAVIFIDLSGFTGLSETLGPNAIRELLNQFYVLVDQEVVACGGVISSFMGDGAMVMFGVPQPGKDDAFDAARCCVGLCGRTNDWLATLPPTIASRTGFKIGAHFGTVVASRLGSGDHQQITATGDTVNVASRLMEVAAGHGAEVAVSSEMLQIAGQDCAFFKSGALRGPVETRIRGRSGSVAIWLWQSAPDEQVHTN
jgi:adenylate cyclase